MSSLSFVLAGEGVEVEFSGDIPEVISMLDQEVPYFSCDGHTFELTSTRAVLGSSWELIIKLVRSPRNHLPPAPVGRIELEALDGHKVLFKIPPRDPGDSAEFLHQDPAGRLIGSFMFQSLNMLHHRGLISLPGTLPSV